MESLTNPATFSIPESRKTCPSIQVLRIHKTSPAAEHEDDSLPEGISICHASLAQPLCEAWINVKQIDAVVVGTECSISDIVSIRETVTRNVVPLILHTEKFEWKTKEIALESSVDEYHVGHLDQSFIKRVKLIKQVKLFKDASQSKQKLRRQPDGNPSVKHWFLKRVFDIAISLLIILIILPILIIILPILTLETRGSVLCSSKRVGKNYKIFNLYQFRCLSSGLGQFLRKVHLEELPQVLNVLFGDMSLVGTYPILEQDAEKLTKDGTAWRFLAPAGVVGLWLFDQSEEKTIDNRDCTKLDIEYALTNTIWLDIRILCFHFLNLIVAKLNKKEKEWVHRHFLADSFIPNHISKVHRGLTMASN